MEGNKNLHDKTNNGAGADQSLLDMGLKYGRVRIGYRNEFGRNYI